jgi:hypothetical protein
MKRLITLILYGLIFSSVIGQNSFTISGDGNWKRIGRYGGRHAYIEYKYSHATSHNPAISTGEILFINAKSYAIQNHHTMGYSGWNQPQFAIINYGNYTELWVKASEGVGNGNFTITDHLNLSLNAGDQTDSNLADNGGALKIYNKLPDNAHVYNGKLIVEDGYLGIGDSSPEKPLSILTNGTKRALIDICAAGTADAGIYFDASDGDMKGADYGCLIQKDDLSIELNNYGNNPIKLNTNLQTRFFVEGDGDIGIGTTEPNAKLDVNGTIKAHEIAVTLASIDDMQLKGTLAANNITYTANGNTADFVFEDNYQLKDLTEVEAFILTNKHLPEIPSAAEMEEAGVNLAEMNKLLLMKVEELTLYSIEQEKKIEELTEDRRRETEEIRVENREMRKEIEELRKMVMELAKTPNP